MVRSGYHCQDGHIRLMIAARHAEHTDQKGKFMAISTGGYNAAAAYKPIKTVSPKPADVFKELTGAKNAEDFFKPSTTTMAAQNAADSPVYAAAEKTIVAMNGLARQAADPATTAEERTQLDIQYNDMANQLRQFGIGTDTQTSPTPNARLSSLNLGLAGTGLSSAPSADASVAATDAALSRMAEQRVETQSEANRAESADRNSAAQQFNVDQILNNQQKQAATDIQDARVNAAVTAYKTQQDTTSKRQGVLKLLA